MTVRLGIGASEKDIWFSTKSLPGPASARNTYPQITQITPGNFIGDRPKSPLPLLRERKGPSPQGWEGEGERRAPVDPLALGIIMLAVSTGDANDRLS